MAFFHEITAANPEIGVITFKSVTTGAVVSFPAFITTFNDNFTVSAKFEETPL